MHLFSSPKPPAQTPVAGASPSQQQFLKALASELPQAQEQTNPLMDFLRNLGGGGAQAAEPAKEGKSLEPALTDIFERQRRGR